MKNTWNEGGCDTWEHEEDQYEDFLFVQNAPFLFLSGEERNEWEDNNRDEIRERQKKYRDKNRDRIREYHRKWRAERKALRLRLDALASSPILLKKED